MRSNASVEIHAHASLSPGGALFGDLPLDILAQTIGRVPTDARGQCFQIQATGLPGVSRRRFLLVSA